jgi:putative ABC transport system permease protein
MRELLRRLVNLLRRRREDAELAEEIAFHRAMHEQTLEADGETPAVAASAAQRALGNDLAARERSRDVWIPPWFQDIGQDVRFAARMLVKHRWFTAAAIIALGLGIGANTTVFTLVNAITWRGLPVAEPHRIVTVFSFDQGGRQVGVSYPDFRDWQNATSSFDELAAMSGAVVNIGDADRAPDRLNAPFISWNAFGLLGDRPVLGREFREDDDRPGAPAVIILGHHVWRDRYGADAGVIGRTVTVNGQPTVVIGVMAEGFQFPALADAWRPLGLVPDIEASPRGARNLRVFGKLAANASRREAAAEVNSIAARLALAYPDTNTGVRVTVEPFTGRADEPFLLAMYVAVSFVLLIACANVASLLLARASQRTREIAMRGALGAPRWRVVRQLLVESLMMATLAAGLGLLFAKLGMWLFVGDTDPTFIAYWVHWTMDARVYMFLTVAAVTTLLLFGIVPALTMSRGVRGETLKEGGRTSTSGARRLRSTSVLLVAELALTVVLLAGAGLMTRSLLAMQAGDEAIESARLLTAGITPSAEKYATPDQRIALMAHLDSRLRAIPALASATVTSHLPFVGAASRRLSIEGEDERAIAQRPVVLSVTIGDRYFETLELRLLQGREFTTLDGTAGHETIIVNRAFATRFFPNQDPLGRRIRLADPAAGGDPGVWATIVGVAPTIRQQPQQQTVQAVAYLPLQTMLRAPALGSLTLMVRTDAEPAALTGMLRDELRQIDPDLAVSKIQPLGYYAHLSTWTHRLFSRIFSVFAGVALLLSAVGLFAVTAFAVSQRTQEVGVRMALGARRGQVLWLFARQTVARAVAGLILGFSGAIAVGTLLQGLLVQTSPTDLVMLTSTALLLLIAVAAATVIPVRRAMRLDPVAALRHE